MTCILYCDTSMCNYNRYYGARCKKHVSWYTPAARTYRCIYYIRTPYSQYLGQSVAYARNFSWGWWSVDLTVEDCDDLSYIKTLYDFIRVTTILLLFKFLWHNLSSVHPFKIKPIYMHNYDIMVVGFKT